MQFSPSIGRFGVRVGDPEPAQYSRFKPLHYSRFVVGFVVVADKVQKSMNNQMGEVVGKVQPQRRRFGRNGFPGHDDVAEERPEAAGDKRRGGKGQDIGGPVLATILPVERADTGVVGEDQGDLGVRRQRRKVRRPAGGERPLDQRPKVGFGGPAIGLDQKIG